MKIVAITGGIGVGKTTVCNFFKSFGASVYHSDLAAKEIMVSDLVLKNAFQNSAIVIESIDGAIIDNLNFKNCDITNCGQAIFIILADRKRTVPGRKARIGSISNVSFELKSKFGDKIISASK